MVEHHVLILTGTINPNRFKKDDKKINVLITETEERLNQYENTIKRFINESIFTDLCFVENSGYPFNKSKFELMAHKVGKRFEFLYMELNSEQIEKMIACGKSFGEALLIDYAMRNSELVRNQDTVYKITGRLFLRNSHIIVKHAKNNVSEAICEGERKIVKYRGNFPGNWFHTEFFKFMVNDYFKAFNLSWELCDDYKDCGQVYSKYSIEQIYYRLAKDNNIEVDNFYHYPDLEGICASSQNLYNQSKLKLFIKSLLCKINFYSLK